MTKAEIDISKVPLKAVPIGWLFVGATVFVLVAGGAVAAAGAIKKRIKGAVPADSKVATVMETW